MKVKVVFPARL